MSQAPPLPPPYSGSPAHGAPPPGGPGGSIGLAAMIVGIVAFLLGLVPVVGLVCGAAAVVLGIVGLRRVRAGGGSGRGFAVTGLVLGGIAVLTGLVVAIALLAGIGSAVRNAGEAPSPPADASAGDVGPTSDPEAAPAEEPAPEAAAATIGTPISSGDLGFLVSAVDCSTTTIGSDGFGETAQGKYCIVDLAVTNNGDEANYFTDSQATLLNAERQQFSASSDSIYLEEGSFLEQINPGNTLAGKIVFDVPVDMTPTALTLRDGPLDEGVEVGLG